MKERVAAMDAVLFLSNIWADVKFSLRQLRKNPGFTGKTIYRGMASCDLLCESSEGKNARHIDRIVAPHR